MDGNGRWAQQRGLPRIEGHRRGVASVRRITEHCVEAGIEQLTLYCLSSENWRRPPTELSFLMHLLEQYMIEERALLMRQGISVSMIGSRAGIPAATLEAIDQTHILCAGNQRMHLCLAINYGARAEITNAARRLVREAQEGSISADDIDEQMVAARLDTAGQPDPDLLIRTAGEMRVSNFLLWQISYAEIVIVKKFWPDFRPSDLFETVKEYQRRHRRFGAL
jgi:undecaprenyl diphosphate synthase